MGQDYLFDAAFVETFGRPSSDVDQVLATYASDMLAAHFPAANATQRAELWKWDAAAPTGQVVAPQVLGVAVNDGSAQRSVVTGLTITFDRNVDIDDGALTLKDANGKSILLYIEDPVSGSDTLSIDFGGRSLPDGRYTLTVRAGKVTDAATGGALAADYTFTFTRP